MDKIKIGNPERRSGIELIKIVAIILIILCHAMPNELNIGGYTYVNGVAQSTSGGLIVNFISGAGLAGDVIFLVCSAYFLCDSKRIKVQKVFYMIFTVFIISVIFLTVYLCMGYELNTYTIVRMLFPTIFQNNWFISYYLALYLLHPLINAVINRLNKLTHGIVAAYLFFHCCILLYVQGNAPSSNKFLCILCIYFVVAYLKRYARDFMQNRRLNAIICCISIAVYIILRVVINYAGLYNDYLYERQLGYVHINCPVLIVFAITLMNAANGDKYKSRAANYISSASMLIYILTSDILFREYTLDGWFLWFESAFGAEYALLSILIFAIILFTGGLIVATIYKLTLGQFVYFISAKCEILTYKILNKIKDVYLRCKNRDNEGGNQTTDNAA